MYSLLLFFYFIKKIKINTVLYNLSNFYTIIKEYLINFQSRLKSIFIVIKNY
jgi:hypothetical protein